MGVNLKELIIKKKISLTDLSNKTLAVDSFNLLYQFLSTIRSADGSFFTDSRGRVTSHLIGLFNRTIKLMENNIKLIFVFDGKIPELKEKEISERRREKEKAEEEFKTAQQIGDLESMRKFAIRTTSLTDEMIEESKRLISALGHPVIQAPSEGEAQTSYLIKKGEAYASVSQDYDNLLFGCPLMVRNLSIEERRKIPGKPFFTEISPELINLAENLKNLGINQEQLIVLGVLIGTDFNPTGIPGIGPKTALKLIHQFKDNFEALFEKVEWDKHFGFSWQEIFDLIKNMPVTDTYQLKWKEPDEKRIKELLIEEHNFSKERVEKRLETLRKTKEKQSQKGLGGWF